MQHLACIMDGNRRYALKHGWQPWTGHEKGVDAVRIALDFCLQQAIPYLSLYTFSIENFKRSQLEKDFLFALILEMANRHVNEAIEKGIKIKFVGDRALFPEHLIATCDDIERKTVAGQHLQVNFLFCYGGQQEITDAVKRIACKIKSGQLHESDITEQLIMQHLWTHDTPAPDLIIRTGGQQRVSNFLLFQSAYSEYYFTDQYWPALTTDDFAKACELFNMRKRNFGT